MHRRQVEYDPISSYVARRSYLSSTRGVAAFLFVGGFIDFWALFADLLLLVPMRHRTHNKQFSFVLSFAVSALLVFGLDGVVVFRCFVGIVCYSKKMIPFGCFACLQKSSLSEK